MVAANAFASAHRLSLLPLILQWEIADALPGGREVIKDMEAAGSLHVARPLPGRYLSTNRVLQQFAAVWRERGFSVVAVVAQRDHTARCRQCVEDLGFQIVPVPTQGVISDWSFFGCDQDGYDPRSRQPWTKVRWRFLVFNACATWIQACKER